MVAFGAEAEPALLLACLHQKRNQQSFAGSRDMHALHRDIDGARSVIRKCLALELRLDQLVDLGERHIDRHADATLPRSICCTSSSFAGNVQAGLRLCRHDARLGLHAERQRDVAGVDARLRGEGAGRAHLEPQVRKAGAAAAQRDRAAHLRPFAPRRLFEDRIVAQPRLQDGGLFGDAAIDQRLRSPCRDSLRTAAIERLASLIFTWPRRFGSSRQFGVSPAAT